MNTNQTQGPLARSYGTVMVPKGTLLYHICTTPLCSLPTETPFLFTTLHPSEYMKFPRTTIATIEVQRDIKLFFMISILHRLRVFSALTTFLDMPINSTEIKQNIPRLQTWLSYLQTEGFDGWFTSIEGKTDIEFAIRSDPSILKIVECSPNQLDWRNSNYIRGVWIPK